MTVTGLVRGTGAMLGIQYKNQEEGLWYWTPEAAGCSRELFILFLKNFSYF